MQIAESFVILEAEVIGMSRKTMIGMCSSDPNEVRILKKYGYDFYEGDFATITAMPQEEYEGLLEATRETGLRSLGMNCFAYPPHMLLEMSLEALDEYLESRLPRALELGLQYLVIGSGGARRRPDWMSHEQATEKFVAMLKRYAAIADRYDIEIIIEPLYRTACNFVNTYEEGLAICRTVDHPRVGILMDFFHSYHENEPYSVLKKAGPYLKHIHLAAEDDKHIPVRGEEEITARFVRLLKEIGYSGRIVLEGEARPDFETGMKQFSEQFSLFD